MSNKLNHQIQQRAFSRQPRTSIEQILPTSDLAPAGGMLTDSGGAAGLPRVHPPDVLSDIARVSARQPAQPTPGSPRGRGATLVHFGYTTKTGPRTHTSPGTAANNQTSRMHQSRGARQHPEITPASQELRQRPPGGVRQDKARFENARTASRQPARMTEVNRAPLTNNSVVRSQSLTGASQKLVQVTLWVDPAVKTHLERLADQEGLKFSPAGAAFLRKAVQQDIDLQYSALLRPIIEDAIAKQMRGIATRLSWLLVRIAFDAGQTRSMVTNILGRQPGVTDPLLKTILDASGRSAKANIMRRTPQISQLIEAVEQWMIEDDDRGEGTSKQID